MIVLGLQRGHDAGACLMRDGHVLCAVEAERVHRIKHADGPGTIPQCAQLPFDQCGVRPEDIDGIVISDSFRDRIEVALPHICPDLHSTKLLGSIGTYGALAEVSDIGIADIPKDTPVLAACHHACHAAGAIYMSDFDNALVYVYDGWGVCAATAAYIYREGKLLRIEDSVDKLLIGWRYELLASFIVEINDANTKKYDFAGKLMGLNSLGTPCAEAIAHMKSWLRMGFDEYQTTWNAAGKVWFAGLVNEEGFSLDSTSAHDPAFQSLLASLQVAMNEVVCEEIAELRARFDTRNVIVTGGCALNIMTNDAVEALDGIDQVFIPPNANDGGLAMGAAVICSAYGMERELHFPGIARREKRDPFKGPFLIGSAGSGAEPDMADATQLAVLDQVAEALCSGGIVGFVQGRIEVGPRALGHRSLLADATSADMRDVINKKIKLREWWRPFAPVVRGEDADDYFITSNPCPYMLRTAEVREEWRDALKPVVHFDNSARLQVLEDEESDPALWYVLSELKRHTGIGVCLNTSLNIGGRPILNSREEIFEFLENTAVDFMYVDGEILTRP